MSYRTIGSRDHSRLVLQGEEDRNRRLVGCDRKVDEQHAFGYHCDHDDSECTDLDLWSALWAQSDDPQSASCLAGDAMAKLWDSPVDLGFLSEEADLACDWAESPLEESGQESRQEEERIRGLPGQVDIAEALHPSYPTITQSSLPITPSPSPSTPRPLITPSKPTVSESHPYKTHKRLAARGAVQRSNPPKISDPSTFPDPFPNTVTPISAEEDKRRRNTAASARFRAKKKQRESWLEERSKELGQLIMELKRERSMLAKENEWLKSLVKGTFEGK